MNIASLVIAAFGGTTKASKALGIPVTTVDAWKRSGQIPAWRKSHIVATASRENVKLPREYAEAA